jgi:hypothetical protein
VLFQEQKHIVTSVLQSLRSGCDARLASRGTALTVGMTVSVMLLPDGQDGFAEAMPDQGIDAA